MKHRDPRKTVERLGVFGHKLMRWFFVGLFLVAPAAGGDAQAASQKSKANAPTLKLDSIAPRISFFPVGGIYSRLLTLELQASEKAILYYSLDGSEPNVTSAVYQAPITISNEGRTTVKVLAEDLAGNTSPVASQEYWIDTKPPVPSFRPAGGRFGRSVVFRAQADEPCRFFYGMGRPADENGRWFTDSLTIDSSCRLQILPIDMAGNRGEMQTFEFVIDTRVPDISISPMGGIFNHPIAVRLTSDKPARIFYSLDELAPHSAYAPYRDSISIGVGRFLLSCFAMDSTGNSSPVAKASFVVDNTPPTPKFESTRKDGKEIVTLKANEKAALFYTLDGRNPGETSAKYEGKPIEFKTEGLVILKVLAKDEAGNASAILETKFVYDHTAPIVSINRKGGAFNHPLEILLAANEPADIFYTMDGSAVGEKAAKFSDKIILSRNGKTELAYRACDRAGNWSPVYKETYVVDALEPVVTARIEGDAFGTDFRVFLSCNKPSARIYYEIGRENPGIASPTYGAPVILRRGQILSYFAQDIAGNRSKTYLLDELKSPAIAVTPPGGVYRETIAVEMKTGLTAKIHYRLYKTTDNVPAFRDYTAPIPLSGEGVFTLEYYSKDAAGFQSTIRKEKYFIDKTPPAVALTTSKGGRDSTIVLHFMADENVSIYYTLDGSPPGTSPSTAVAANKFLAKEDRVEIVRTKGTEVIFYAEDLAGNRGSETRADLRLPRVVPGIPAGLYHSMQTLSLRTLDQTRIYYTLDGTEPGLGSSLYATPLTLTRTTKLKYFAVDETGFRGPTDSSIVEIDLPPVPRCKTRKTVYYEGDTVEVDAGGTADEEEPLQNLVFRWDWNDDGVFDTPFLGATCATRFFPTPGVKWVTVEVKDGREQISRLRRSILVRKRCPGDMISIAMGGNESFCIDQYEWPNMANEHPLAGFSYVEAFAACRDHGKRLCTAEEWAWSCSGIDSLAYPYGPLYRRSACNSEGKKPVRSGEKEGCISPFGVADMTGNLWEWVNNGQVPQKGIAGGDYVSGSLGGCRQVFPAAMAQHDGKVGFRCCK